MFLCMTPKTKIWVEHRGTYIGGFAWWRAWDIEVNYLTNTCNRLWFVSRPLRLLQWYQYPTTLVREWDRLSRVGLNKGVTLYGEIWLHSPTQPAMFLNRSRNHKTPSSFGSVRVCHGVVYNETHAMWGSWRVKWQRILGTRRCWPTYILEIRLLVPTQHATNCLLHTWILLQ